MSEVDPKSHRDTVIQQALHKGFKMQSLNRMTTYDIEQMLERRNRDEQSTPSQMDEKHGDRSDHSSDEDGDEEEDEPYNDREDDEKGRPMDLKNLLSPRCNPNRDPNRDHRDHQVHRGHHSHARSARSTRSARSAHRHRSRSSHRSRRQHPACSGGAPRPDIATAGSVPAPCCDDEDAETVVDMSFYTEAQNPTQEKWERFKFLVRARNELMKSLNNNENVYNQVSDHIESDDRQKFQETIEQQSRMLQSIRREMLEIAAWFNQICSTQIDTYQRILREAQGPCDSLLNHLQTKIQNIQVYLDEIRHHCAEFNEQ